MFDTLFLAHPRKVNESYGEHFAIASRFGLTMIGAGLALLVHAVVPAFFLRTGSAVIKALYAEMTSRQPLLAKQPLVHTAQEWQLEYEI